MEDDFKPGTRGDVVDSNSEDAKRDDSDSADLEANRGKPRTWPSPLKPICGTSVLIVATILGILINCTSLVIGLNSINDCPAQDAIPIYLVSSGALGLAKIPLFALFHFKTRGAASKSALLKRVYHLLIAVGFGLFVMGSFAVYQQFPSFQPADDRYCDKICYYYAFWFISSIYFFVFLAILILITTMMSGLLVLCFGCIERSLSQNRHEK